MKKYLAITVLIIMLAMLSGCLIFTGVKTPMSDTSTPLNDTPGNKVGKSSCFTYVWAVTTGDCSIKAAMESANIKKIHHVDTDIVYVLLGVYGRTTIVVYGD